MEAGEGETTIDGKNQWNCTYMVGIGLNLITQTGKVKMFLNTDKEHNYCRCFVQREFALEKLMQAWLCSYMFAFHVSCTRIRTFQYKTAE